jgi:hypothetical protein
MKLYSSLSLVSITLALLVFLPPSCLASPASEQYSPLSMQGEEYPNACSQAELARLKESVLNDRVRKAQQVWRLIETILCGPDNNANRAYIKSMIKRNIKVKTQSTGDEPNFKMILRSEEVAREIMAVGEAWDVTIRADAEMLTLQYFENEACMKGVRFMCINSQWIIYEISGACD